MADRRTVIYRGPSLYGCELAADESVSLLPPVRHGDLLALPEVERGDWDIYLVDGDFGQSLAITITEIRTVLCAGNRVHGCSSMGALRATECRPIGMLGHGWIFEAYASGAIDGDDEVALLYEPATYEPLTVPSVNVRWLVDTLRTRGDLDEQDAKDAVRIARGLFFRWRTPAALRRAMAAATDVRPALHAVVEQLADEHLSKWDRKRLDALALVDQALPGSGAPP